MPIRQRFNEWSEIGMRVTVALVNVAKLVVLGITVFFMVKIAFAFCYFIIKLAGTLPIWPVH